VATLWSASAYHTPFLSVIFNNQSYGAIRTIVESLLETPLSDEMGSFAGVDISPPANYALLAEACGGYGRMIDDPSELLPALKEAMAEVRDGRLAVIDVRLAKG
jgi:acetolactate synthase-1/2/3 large subunit